jgi:DNA-binding Xre family transcriptional regulator
MESEETYKWEALMIPIELAQRLHWNRSMGQRLMRLRKGKHSRRTLAIALKDMGEKYSETALQRLEDGKMESIETVTLLQILKAIDSDLSSLLPTVKMEVGLPQ